MLAYRHQFHAGNFADVFKHALLAQLVLALGKKDKPFFYLDTHAGIAHYDLQHEWAQKNAEYKDGVARVWERNDAPPEFAPYLDAVRAENKTGTLRYYPGSPRIARRFMRAGDRMVLTELNGKDCASLTTLFARDRQVKVQLLDGYLALKALSAAAGAARTGVHRLVVRPRAGVHAPAARRWRRRTRNSPPAFTRCGIR